MGKMLLLILSAAFFLLGCIGKKNSGRYLVIDDVHSVHHIFPVEDNLDITLNNFDFMNELAPGMIVTKENFTLLNDSMVPKVRILNTKRHPEIYGDFDKYYTIYLVKQRSASFKSTSNSTDSVHFELLGKDYRLPVRNAIVDSIIVEPIDIQ